MKKLNKKKKILLAVVAVVLAAAIGIGVLLVSPGSSEPVGVYPFQYLGMTEYWGDSQESYGPVTSDNIQTIYLTDTQIVTEIKVKEGDTVKAGDVLMTFDTTLSGLSLERKRLDVEKKKLNLEIANGELSEILEMEPTPEDIEIPEELLEVDLGVALTDAYRISTGSVYDGSSESKALICWLKDTTSINNDILEAIRLTAEEIQKKNAQKDTAASSASALPEESAPAEETREAPAAAVPTEAPTVPTEAPTVPTETETRPAAEASEPAEETTAPTEAVTEPAVETTLPTEAATEPTEETATATEAATEPSEETTAPTEAETRPEEDETVPTEETTAPTEETLPEEEDILVTEFYVVFKTTQDNMSLGTRTQWEGLHVIRKGDGFQFRFYDASGFSDHTIVVDENAGDPLKDFMDSINWGSGYTIQQIRQLRAAKQEEIRQLEFELKLAETEYKIMQKELEDGNVYAAVDGNVVSALTEEEARASNQPILKVSGGGGYYVQCSVSELEKENMAIGMEVTVNNWRSGMTYTGTVDSMGDFPSADGYWNGLGNPNTTYYPFTVFIDGSADLQTNSYVNVTYSTDSGAHGIYLENPFLRTEQGQSYVYVLGSNGKLEKRDVVTGKSLWGSYTEILSGITEDDLIAFPYGKNVKAGAPAEERDISELYSY